MLSHASGHKPSRIALIGSITRIACRMLARMACAVRTIETDLAVGLDGDEGRCEVVEDGGEEIFADKTV